MNVTEFTPEEKADLKEAILAPPLFEQIQEGPSSHLPVTPEGVNRQIFQYSEEEKPAPEPIPAAGPVKPQYDTYRDLLLMALASQVIKMSDSSAEIAQLRTEIAQLRKTLKAAFLAIGHGPIGATFEAPVPKAVIIPPIEDNDDREGLTEEAVQEALKLLPKE